MLIDTRRPPPPPPEPRRRRGWDLEDWRWLIAFLLALALIGLSSLFAPLPAYIMLLGAAVLIARGFSRLVRHTPGLRDYHQ